MIPINFAAPPRLSHASTPSIWGRKTGILRYDLSAVTRSRIQRLPFPVVSPLRLRTPAITSSLAIRTSCRTTSIMSCGVAFRCPRRRFGRRCSVWTPPGCFGRSAIPHAQPRRQPCQGRLPPPYGQIQRGSRHRRPNDQARHPPSRCPTIQAKRSQSVAHGVLEGAAFAIVQNLVSRKLPNICDIEPVGAGTDCVSSRFAPWNGVTAADRAPVDLHVLVGITERQIGHCAAPSARSP